MSYTSNTETIFAFESSEMSEAFSKVHEIFLSNGFRVEFPGSQICLEDIDDINGDWYEFEAVCFSPGSQLELNDAINKLKAHRTGGCLSYWGDGRVWDSDNQDLKPYDALVCFGSLDNNAIQYVLISVKESGFNHFASIYNTICSDIFKRLNVKGATRRVDHDDNEYNANDLAEHILNGTFNEIKLKLELITEFK